MRLFPQQGRCRAPDGGEVANLKQRGRERVRELLKIRVENYRRTHAGVGTAPALGKAMGSTSWRGPTWRLCSPFSRVDLDRNWSLRAELLGWPTPVGSPLVSFF